MKIINLSTNIVFDLPKSQADALLISEPDLFAKFSNKKKQIVIPKKTDSDDCILNKILES